MISVIDVFAGPGGLGEGFSSVRDSSGRQVFKIALSIEKDPIAHQTLRLRSFFRYFSDDQKPMEYYRQVKSGNIDWDILAEEYPEAAKNAEVEVWQAQLGSKSYPPQIVDAKIRKALNDARVWALIGGPPCQVYSQVGRSRIRGESAWHFARDERHLLYKEYLRIIEVHRPPVFIMENVKGILSSRRAGKRIIEQILADLREPLKFQSGASGQNKFAYNLYALGQYTNEPVLNVSSVNGNGSEYIIRCEKHGIPQARHRLILLGIRNDLNLKPKKLQLQSREVNMWKAISDLPPLRSRLSQNIDSFETWVRSIQRVLKYKTLNHESYRDVHTLMKRFASELNYRDTGAQYLRTRTRPKWNEDWFFDAHLGGICNHSTRSHICEDLWRYFYASCFARVRGKSPKLDDFPHFLLPDHGNVGDRNSDLEPYFADRFRVQVKDRPSTTVTSHIGKDGHYFIHPDPAQCRSLTVREAARLQTFPDNYYFAGGRTAQYQQVGNAVPPLLARQIATIVADLFD